MQEIGEIKKGDWIEINGEKGSVINISFEEEEIDLFDGKEGWTVKFSEIEEIKI